MLPCGNCIREQARGACRSHRRSWRHPRQQCKPVPDEKPQRPPAIRPRGQCQTRPFPSQGSIAPRPALSQMTPAPRMPHSHQGAMAVARWQHRLGQSPAQQPWECSLPRAPARGMGQGKSRLRSRSALGFVQPTPCYCPMCADTVSPPQTNSPRCRSSLRWGF